jgi:7,8-dihydroneopterin aldolase/epimerase/oxygenase
VTVVVEIVGLEVPGRHGVLDEEREREQPFVYDVELELAEPAQDVIEHTVDYREVAALVREVSESRQFRLLESIAAAVADGLVERFPVERVRVRVSKPQVRLAVPVGHTAASVERSRP